jgi:glucosyl-3-phosphoglycerate synthase
MASCARMGLQRALDWYGRRTWSHTEWSVERVAAERECGVSVCLPSRNEAATIGPILEVLLPLVEQGVVDQVVVADDSIDGTGEIARGLGAEVHRQADLRPEFGPVCGKGDALWRALEVLRGDVVCFLDADSEEVGPHYVCGLVGPLACHGELQFVKGFYRRPLKVGATQRPEGGGRVTELTARPLLNAFFPELAGFRQPLAGEFAGRRSLLERLPFSTGYAVDVALLIDVWADVGLDGLAQIDLDVRQNRHQPLSDLVPMAAAVAQAILVRLERDGRLTEGIEDRLLLMDAIGPALHADLIEERPPAASLV